MFYKIVSVPSFQTGETIWASSKFRVKSYQLYYTSYFCAFRLLHSTCCIVWTYIVSCFNLNIETITASFYTVIDHSCILSPHHNVHWQSVSLDCVGHHPMQYSNRIKVLMHMWKLLNYMSIFCMDINNHTEYRIVVLTAFKTKRPRLLQWQFAIDWYRLVAFILSTFVDSKSLTRNQLRTC